MENELLKDLKDLLGEIKDNTERTNEILEFILREIQQIKKKCL